MYPSALSPWLSHVQGNRRSGKLCGSALPAQHACALSQHGRHTSSDMPLWRSKYGVLSYCTYRSAMRSSWTTVERLSQRSLSARASFFCQQKSSKTRPFAMLTRLVRWWEGLGGKRGFCVHRGVSWCWAPLATPEGRRESLLSCHEGRCGECSVPRAC